MKKYYSKTESVSQTIKNIIEPLIKRNGGSYQAKIITQWEKIVGVEIAKLTQPLQVRFKKKSHLEARLVLQVEPVGAVLIGFRKDLILQKITSFFGKTIVNDIQFIQKPISQTYQAKQQSTHKTEEKITLNMALLNLEKAINNKKATRY